MGVIIEPTTAAKDSQPFVVQRGETVGLSADGLAGAEVAVIKKLNSSGVFRDVVGDGSSMTATDPDVRIIASGTYLVSKAATASASGVRLD